MEQAATIDRLLNLVPEAPNSVLSHLRAHPQLAVQQDAHGYSLVHASVSYGHLDLLRALIEEFNVDPNILDEDGETCLFNAESVDFAQELLRLGVKIDVRNEDGQTAAEKLDDPDEQPEVAAYLKEAAQGPSATAASGQAQTAGSSISQVGEDGEANGVHPPPPLPDGVQINIGTMQNGEEGGEPDPEFRRRIEELASRQDFEGEEGQRELRNLVSEAISGLTNEGQGQASRRRLG